MDKERKVTMINLLLSVAIARKKIRMMMLLLSFCSNEEEQDTSPAGSPVCFDRVVIYKPVVFLALLFFAAQ